MEQINEQIIEQIIQARGEDISKHCSHALIGSKLMPQLLEVDAERGEALFRFEIMEEMTNPVGTMHGGLIVTAFDSAMGILGMCVSEGRFVSTISLTTHFHKPVLLGGGLIVRVRMVSKGKNIIALAAEGWNENTPEKIAVSAMAEFFVMGG